MILRSWFDSIWPNLAASFLLWSGVELRNEARHIQAMTGRRPSIFALWQKRNRPAATTQQTAAAPGPPCGGTPDSSSTSARPAPGP